MRLRNCFIYVWACIDPIYYFLTRLISLAKQSMNKHNIFRVRLTCYKGCEVTLSDGTLIQPNDLLIKIHLHNVSILKEVRHFNNEITRGKWIYRAVERSLPDLASYLKEHERYDDLKGIIGITMLGTVPCRLGFEEVPISNGYYKWFKWLVQVPISYLMVINFSWRTVCKQEPHYLFMSKTQLFNKYGKEG